MSSKSKSKERSSSNQANLEDLKRLSVSIEKKMSPKKLTGKIRKKRLKSAFVLGGNLAQTQIAESQNLLTDSAVITMDVKKMRSP